MEIANHTRLTARAALLASGLSLCCSVWMFGCQSDKTHTKTTAKDTTVAPQTPTPATPKPAEVQKPTPEKTGIEKSPTEGADPKQAKDKPGKRTQLGAGDVRVKRLVVTTGVEQREPVEASELTADEGPIYAFVELGNGSDEDQIVVVTFEHPDENEAVGHIKLKVPAGQPRWRTWGRTRMIREGGEWVAVVSTEDGRELSRQPFQVKSS